MDTTPNITLTNCPICDNNHIEKTLDVVDHFSSKETFPLFDCHHCRFRFTNNFPSENNIDRYYDSPDYISHSDSDKGIINKLYHIARKIMLKRKVRLVSAHTMKKPIRLLDMGCGTGYFLNAAKEKGVTVSGIEKNKIAREYAVNQFGLDVKGASYFWEIKSESYNAITLWHVLEHLENLNESIDKIKNILTEDGVAIIAVPNFRSLDASFYKKNWAAYDVPRHLWHFSPESIENLLARHEMCITKCYSMPLDALYVSLLSEKYRNANFLLRYGRALFIGLLGLTCSFFKFQKASSIIYIAYKKKFIDSLTTYN